MTDKPLGAAVREAARELRASCPVCGRPARWERDPGCDELLLSCAACGLERAGADEVQQRSDDHIDFERLGEGRYRLALPQVAGEIEVDYLRRDGGQLKGELLVNSDLPGALGFRGVLSVSDLNLSSARARAAHAKHLAERARTKDSVDWETIVEEFALRVLAAEREGEPAVLLADLPRPEPDRMLEVLGLPLLARHPLILFGDGGAVKSYLALYIAGALAQRGVRAGLFDWELDGEDHRDRLERLFGANMPAIHYARCTRPLAHDADRLRRIVRDARLDYAVFDSVAFACDGPPEAAEVVGRYFQALRRLGEIGSLHVAHVTKALEGADRRPFGSTFWHNGARATWNVQLAEAAPDDTTVNVALHNRKANLGPRRPSVGFEFRFEADRTHVCRADPADLPDLAAGLSLSQRVATCLRHGPRSRAEIAAELLEDVKPETLRRTLNRAIKTGKLLRLPGPDELIGLPHRGPEP